MGVKDGTEDVDAGDEETKEDDDNGDNQEGEQRF
jgi:hypothetical protein